VLHSTSRCLSAVATASDFVTRQLPARLTSTLQAVRQHAPAPGSSCSATQTCTTCPSRAAASG
jgi:hypothetical protein